MEGWPVDWAKIYRREARVSWEDLATVIHDTVTMDDVLALYCPQVKRRGKRCACPIHNGEDLNFSFTDRGYKCFVCGASGDVVAFVKDVCELSTRADAMRQISEDFNLGFYFGDIISREKNNKISELKRKAKEKEQEREAWWTRYHALTDEWCALDRDLRSGAHSPAEVARANMRMAELRYELNSLPPEPR